MTVGPLTHYRHDAHTRKEYWERQLLHLVTAHWHFQSGGTSDSWVGFVSPEHGRDLGDHLVWDTSWSEARREAGCCALWIPASVTLILASHYTHVSLSLQGYRQKDYFIATQGPLPHTVEDFWRMVWEWKCHTIVMLTEVQEREQVCVARLHFKSAIKMSLCVT